MSNLKYDSLSSEEKNPSLGEEMKSEFSLKFDEVTLCNQGSYGIAPKRVLTYKKAIIDEMESYPDEFFRITSRPMYDSSLNAAAKFLNSAPQDLVFVPNTTTGINTILKGIEFEPESLILHTNHTYLSTRYTIDYVVTAYDADILSSDVPIPITSERQIVNHFYKLCNFNRSIRVIVLDLISSCSGILWPVAKIAAALKRLDVIVIVDGAHGPGQVNVNLLELEQAGVDFFVGNLHKWCFTPISCAVMWVKHKYQDKLRPLITSNTYHGTFQDQFFYQGTLDISSYLTAEASIDFHKSIGGFDALHAYIDPMLSWAQEIIADALGTEKLQLPKSMEAPFMKLVALPPLDGLEPTLKNADRLTVQMMKDHSIVVSFTEFDGRIWVRLSGSCFNVREDYVKVKEALVKFFKKY